MAVMTAAQIDRSFKRWQIFTLVYRIWLVLTAFYYIFAITAGSTMSIVYLILNPAYWMLSIWWMNMAKDTRAQRYKSLARRQELERFHG